MRPIMSLCAAFTIAVSACGGDDPAPSEPPTVDATDTAPAPVDVVVVEEVSTPDAGPIEKQAPEITVVQPDSGTIVDDGAEVEFLFAVTDADTPLSQIMVTIVSDVDGELGSGPAASGGFSRFTATPSRGVHEITVTATDPDELSAEATFTLTANGAPEGLEGVTIAPEAPTSSEELEATVTGSPSDLDRDPSELSLVYRWSRNDELQEGLTGASVPDGYTSKGDTWTVAVTVSDGRLESEAVSASTSISNSAPTCSVVSVNWSEEDPSTLICACDDRGEADGEDPIEDTCSFTFDEAVVQEGACEWTPPADASGDVTCTLSASDGEESAEAVTSEPLTLATE